MISTADKNLLKDLYLQGITFEEFQKKSSLCGNDNPLGVAISQQDNELLEYLLVYYYHFGFDQKLCDTLQKLMIVDWHRQHSEIARILQFKLHCSDSIDYLIRSIEKRYSYLFEQDDYYPFVRKCLNAIRVIGTEDARIALIQLVNGTTDQEIKQLAERQLTKI